MSHALFLHEARSLDAALLREAFDSCGTLTSADADRWAPSTASGVVATGLSAEDARVVARALRARGCGVEPVDQGWLSLPEPRALRRAQPKLAGLEVLDTYGRAQLIPWEQVVALTAGVVRSGRAVRERDMQQHYNSLGTEDDAVYRYQESDALIMDVVVEEPLRRYRITSNRFDYDYLGKKKKPQSNDNFSRLLRDVVAYAGELAVGRGAQLTLADPKSTRRHQSPLSYNAELAWVLWRHVGPGAAFHGEPVRRRAPYTAVGPSPETPIEGSRQAAAARVMEGNALDHDRHIHEYRSVDMALSALAGVVLGYVVAEEIAASPVIYWLELLGVAALVTVLVHPFVRSWRSNRFWMR